MTKSESKKNKLVQTSLKYFEKLNLFLQKYKKPFALAGSVLEWSVFIVLIFTFLVVLSPILPTKKYIYTYIVATGSMEPTIKAGSIVLVKPADVKNLKKGDIITFTSPKDTKTTILHRIHEVKTIKKEKTYITKGDNNNAPDNWTVTPSLVRGSFITSIPYLGHPAALLKTKQGFGLMIVLPAIILALLQVKTIKEGINEEVERRTLQAIAKSKAKSSGKRKRKNPLVNVLILAIILNSFIYLGSYEYVKALLQSTVTINNVSFSVIDFVPPSTPTGLRYLSPNLACGSRTNSYNITADWNDSVAHGSKTVVSYEYESFNPPNGWKWGPVIVTASQRPGAFTVGAGMYGFRVRAVDNLGYKSEWTAVDISNSCQVTYDPNPPAVPLLRSPSDNTIINSSGLTQTWTFVTDAEGSNPVTYYYESCDVDPRTQVNSICPSSKIRYTATYTIANKQTIAGEERIVKNASGANEGTFWWRVRAIDTVGNRSNWSEVWKMTIDNTKPTLPGKIGWTTENPPIGTDYLTGSDFADYASCGAVINKSPMTNIWSPSTDNVGPVTYDREVYVSETAVAPIYTITLSSNYENGTFPYQGVYWVRLRAKDAAGNTSAWTPRCSITYQVIDAPTNLGWWQGTDATRFTAPNTSLPLDYSCGTESNPALTNKNWIAHSWSSVTSPVGTVKYQREVTYPDGSVAYYLPDSSTNNYTNFRGFNETPPYLDIGQEGLWKTRVRAYIGTDPSGSESSTSFISDWSNMCYIRLDHTNPTSVITTGINISGTNINNPDNDNDAGGYHNHLINLLNWNGRIEGTATDPESGVKQIVLSIKRTRVLPFFNGYWDGSAWVSGGTEESIRVTATGTNSWYYQLPSHPTGTYTIKSHAIDNAGNIENTYTLVIVNESEEEPVASITLSEDKKSLSFEVNNMSGYDLLDYAIKYNAYSSEKGILGSDVNIKDQTHYEKTGIDLATCSGEICTYDTNINNVTLVITLKKLDGSTKIVESKL